MPMWAKPRANPPPKASPSLGRGRSFVWASAESRWRDISWLKAFTERTIRDSCFIPLPCLSSSLTMQLACAPDAALLN